MTSFPLMRTQPMCRFIRRSTQTEEVILLAVMVVTEEACEDAEVTQLKVGVFINKSVKAQDEVQLQLMIDPRAKSATNTVILLTNATSVLITLIRQRNITKLWLPFVFNNNNNHLVRSSTQILVLLPTSQTDSLNCSRLKLIQARTLF